MLQPRHLTKRVAVTPDPTTAATRSSSWTNSGHGRHSISPARRATATCMPYIGLYSLYSIYMHTWLTSLVDARFRSHRKIPKLQKPEGIEKITIFGAETPKNWWRPARDVIVMPSENFPTGGFCRKTDVGCWSWQFFVAHDKKIESYLATNFAGSRNPKIPGGYPKIWGVPKSRNLGSGDQNHEIREIREFDNLGSKTRNLGVQKK